LAEYVSLINSVPDHGDIPDAIIPMVIEIIVDHSGDMITPMGYDGQAT
jgi:hypothetical protein